MSKEGYTAATATVENKLNALEILDKFGIELEGARLAQGGTELQAFCPFHDDRAGGSASFYLNVEGLMYRCFGCQTRGYITQLIEHMTNLTQAEVQQALKGNLPEHYKKVEYKRNRDRYLSQLEVDCLSRYIDGLHILLKKGHELSIDGLQNVKAWREYLTIERGLSWDTIEYFKLGANCLKDYGKYFVDHNALAFLPSSTTASALVNSLNLFNRAGGDYWWKPAIIIPYLSEGRAYYANARILPASVDGGAKYFGLKEVARDLLFNDNALDGNKEIFAVEGEFNCMAMWNVGFENVVSFGSKSQLQKQIGKFFGKDVILYVDTDASDPEFKSRTQAIESLQNSARTVRYFELPEGVDINDYLKEHSRSEFENEVLSNIQTPQEFQPGEYRVIPEAERRQEISLADAQRINADFMAEVAQNLPAYSGKRILDNMPVGTAKTTAAINLLNTTRDDPALVLTASHYLAADYDDNIAFDRFTIHLLGRTHREIECPYAESAARWGGLGYSLYFRMAYCLGCCEKRDDCLHVKLQQAARTAPVLIATHAHGTLKDFFTSPYYGNNRRKLIVIDEEADLIRNVYLKRKDIQHNIDMLEKASVLLMSKGDDLNETQLAGAEAHALAQVLGELEQARLARVGYKPDVKPYTNREAYLIDKAICQQVTNNITLGNKLHDLIYAINNSMEFYYDHTRDAVFYTWRARFPEDACVIFLSGTTPKEYLERTLDIKVDSVVGEKYYVKRENLEVVQLLSVTGGRSRLLRDVKLQEKIKELFQHALERHKNDRILVITSQGAGIPGDMTAKERVIDFLQPIAEQFGRVMENVATETMEQPSLPFGETAIPVIHYGIRGTNKFADYDVVIELNAHYYHQQAILEGVRRNFGVDIGDSKPVKQMVTFKTLDKEYQVERYSYGDPEVDLYIRANQQADIVQAEGRALRGQDTNKIIYRLHNVNVEPYPDRTYKSWQTLFKGEFGVYELSGKIAEVYGWIQENVQPGQEFSTRQIADALGGYVRDINRRYLAELEYYEYIKNIQQGQGVETRWKLKN